MLNVLQSPNGSRKISDHFPIILMYEIPFVRFQYCTSAVAGQIEKRDTPVPSRTFSQRQIELTAAGYVIM